MKERLQAYMRMRTVVIASIAALFIGVTPAVQAYAPAGFISTSTPQATTPSIVITRANLGAEDTGAALIADDVSSQVQLIEFAKLLMREDSRITSISIGTGSVSMSYISSIHVPHAGSQLQSRTVTMANDGSVSVSEPWYFALAGAGPSSDSLQKGFADISIQNDSDGITTATVAHILTRMHGRFQLGLI